MILNINDIQYKWAVDDQCLESWSFKVNQYFVCSSIRNAFQGRGSFHFSFIHLRNRNIFARNLIKDQVGSLWPGGRKIEKPSMRSGKSWIGNCKEENEKNMEWKYMKKMSLKYEWKLWVLESGHCMSFSSGNERPDKKIGLIKEVRWKYLICSSTGWFLFYWSRSKSVEDYKIPNKKGKARPTFTFLLGILQSSTLFGRDQ